MKLGFVIVEMIFTQRRNIQERTFHVMLEELRNAVGDIPNTDELQKAFKLHKKLEEIILKPYHLLS